MEKIIGTCEKCGKCNVELFSLELMISKLSNITIYQCSTCMGTPE